MKILHYLEKSARDDLILFYKSSRLIPFLGAGFTKSCRAKNGKTPDADQLTKIITESAAARQIDKIVSESIINIKDLKMAFNLMKNEKFINIKQALNLCENFFSKVSINDKNKIDFLDLNWPHVFTFNIDDGIENNIKKYDVISPNKIISREYISSHRCLFKIHGDINECIQQKKLEVVFTWRDYVGSIEGNASMLSFLKDKAADTCFIFIGCSLDKELDLMHLSKNNTFSKSIFIKKGKPSLHEELELPNYGIEKIIWFDDYDQIYTWIVECLSKVERISPTRNLVIDDLDLSPKNLIEIIANGGPISGVNKDERVALLPPQFPVRTKLDDIKREIKSNSYILISGRRFSGKTQLLFQLVRNLSEYSATFFASADQFDQEIIKKLYDFDHHIFIFDSNFLSEESLRLILDAKLEPSNRVVICSSSGDAELVRSRMDFRGIYNCEIEISNNLNSEEEKYFNLQLGLMGLPLYKTRENLLDLSFRYHNEFKDRINKIDIFTKKINNELIYILLLISVFGKADQEKINCVIPYFDFTEFINSHDKLFEVEFQKLGENKSIVCNSQLWLIKFLAPLILDARLAADVTIDLIKKLYEKGFYSAANEFIRFDKLNELGDGANIKLFIKKIYANIADVYHEDAHYWLQRAKSELISSENLVEILEGTRYASKVRMDLISEKNQTYYSATLVLAQLYAKAFKLKNELKYLKGFLDNSLESVRNYEANSRYIKKFFESNNNAVRDAVMSLSLINDISLLERKNDIKELTDIYRSLSRR